MTPSRVPSELADQFADVAELTDRAMRGLVGG